MSHEANRQKATVQVKVAIVNPDTYLRPEMNATVRFLANEEGKKSSGQASGVVVPINAVRDHDGKKVVFIAFNGKALMREIRVVSQRSGGYLVNGVGGGEGGIILAPADFKNGARNKNK